MDFTTGDTNELLHDLSAMHDRISIKLEEDDLWHGKHREAAEYIGVSYRTMQSYIRRSYPMNEASWTLVIQKARF